MRARVVIVLLVVSFSTCAFAANKNVKQPPWSTGILIASTFDFTLVGDGISTTFNITPRKIPQNKSPNSSARWCREWRRELWNYRPVSLHCDGIRAASDSDFGISFGRR